MTIDNHNSVIYQDIHAGIVTLLETARAAAARSVNVLMTASYWEIGRRIVAFEQGGEARAGYGEGLIPRLAEDLTRRFGRGFSERNIEQMRKFYLSWPIPQTLSAQFTDLDGMASRFPLPWSAYVGLLSVRDPAARAFYEREALRCGWSVRQLDRQINSLFYERALLSRDKAGKFSHADAGQMHLYLNYAREHWMCEGENPPVELNQLPPRATHYVLMKMLDGVLTKAQSGH